MLACSSGAVTAPSRRPNVAFLPIALVGYVGCILLATLATVYQSAGLRRAASVAFGATWVVHLAAVIQEGSLRGGTPLTSGAGYLLVLGWIVLTLHLFVWFRLQLDVTGLVLPPLAASATLLAWALLSGGAERPPVESKGWLLFHVTVSTLGMAILCVAFAMAVLYLLQDRGLKAKRRLSWMQRLPALEKCDRLGLQALVVGFLLLTIGIATGIVVNADLHERLWVPGIKQLLPVLAWLVFASVLTARTLLGFRGRKSAYLTIAGFALGLMSVLGMNL